MWETILKLATRLKGYAFCKVGKKYMTTNQIQQQFAPLYDKVTASEAKLEELITDYATGNDVRLADIDEVFKEMKAHLREIRNLALEYKENNQ